MTEKSLYDKEKIVYLDILPEELKEIYKGYQKSIIEYLKETTMIYYESQRYDNIVKHICPLIDPVTKMYKPENEVKIMFIELLVKCLFHPTKELTPSEIEGIMESLALLIKGKIKGHFIINWEPVIQFLETFFSGPKRNGYHISKKADSKIKLALPHLLFKLKRFFPPESSEQIYKYVRSYIGPNQHRDSHYLFYLHCLITTNSKLLPVHYDYWMKELLVLWDNNIQSRVFCSTALSLLSNLARTHYEIDWDPYMEKISTLISCTLPYQTKDGEFLVNLNNISGIISPEENLCQNAVKYGARFVISLLKPANGAKCKVLYYIERALLSFKTNLYPGQRTSPIGFIESKFVQSLLASLCSRIKYERYKKVLELSEEHKLKDIDIHVIVDIIIDLLEPSFFCLVTCPSIALALQYMAYLYPEKVFDHYIPKLLRFLEDYNIPHNHALTYINSLVNPLLFHPTFPKKFMYLNLILDYANKEIISVKSENNSLALGIISNIVYFVPLPHQLCLEKAYKSAMQGKDMKNGVDYGAFLTEKRKSNENEYYYHEMCNTIEVKLCDIIGRIFGTLEVKEKPSRKDSADEYAQRILEIADAICMNSTEELFDVVLSQFRTFLLSDPHPNSSKEINMLIKFFAKRRPEAISKIVVQLVFQALVNKEEDPKIWTSPLGVYFKNNLPLQVAIASKYSLSKSAKEERLKYYCSMLSTLLTEFADAYKMFKENIETLLILLMLSRDKNQYKQAGQLIYSVLIGSLVIHSSLKMLIEQDRWATDEAKLTCYKTIGQFDKKMLDVKYTKFTKEGIELSRDIINKFCFGVGELILDLLGKGNNTEAISLIMMWTQIASKIIPGYMRYITKNGKCEFSSIEVILKKKCGDDLELVNYVMTLRPNLLKVMNKIVKALTPLFAEQASQKLAVRTLSCLLNIASLFYDYKQLSKTSQLNFAKSDKQIYKNPTIKDNIRKYTFYTEKSGYVRTQLSRYFEKENEVLFPELREAIYGMLEITQHLPSMKTKLQFKILLIIKNLHDPKGEFYEDLFLKSFAKAQLLLQTISKSTTKENPEDKILGWYINVMRLVIMQHPPLLFKGDYFYKNIIKDIMQFIFNLDKQSLQVISTTLLYTLEDTLECPMHKKRINVPISFKAMDIIDNVDSREREAIREKHKDRIVELTNEKEKWRVDTENKIKEITESVAMQAASKIHNNGTSAITNTKNESVIIVLLSLLAGHHAKNPEMLTSISNAISSSLLSSSNFCRSFASLNLIEILALRQRMVVTPEFIYREEYASENLGIGEGDDLRFCNVKVDPKVLLSHRIPEGQKLYVEKIAFGWLCTPPYIRVYNGEIPFEKCTPDQKKNDLLGEMLNSAEYVNKLVAQAVLDHEAKEEQERMKEDNEPKTKLDFILKAFMNQHFGNSDYFSQIFSSVFKHIYTVKTKYFNPNIAAFYQSCFEFYGSSPFKLFAGAIEKIIVDEKNNNAQTTGLEIVVGFLRAMKCFAEKSCEEQKQFCYSTLIRIIKNVPAEMFDDISESINFFMHSRDPIRFTDFWPRLLKELQPSDTAGILEKTKYYKIVFTIFNIWLWRGKEFADAYMNSYIKNMIHDSEKVCTYTGGNLGLILYRAYDFLKFDFTSVPAKITEANQYKRKEEIREAICKAIKEVDELESSKDEKHKLRLRSIKLSILHILNEIRVYERNRDQPQLWLLELIVPFCYRLTTDDDKTVSQSATTITLQLMKLGLRENIVKVMLEITTKLTQSDVWRLRSIGVADTTGYLKENIDLLKDFDISKIVRMLYDPEIEVRSIAGLNLATILAMLNKEQIEVLANDFKTKLQAVKTKQNETTNGLSNKIIIHGSILGLIAIVNAHGIEIKPWIPDTLSYLSKFRNNYGEASESVRVCLSDFWKRHRPSWDYVKDKFTEDQQMEISEHINPYNYFA